MSDKREFVVDFVKLTYRTVSGSDRIEYSTKVSCAFTSLELRIRSLPLAVL